MTTSPCSTAVRVVPQDSSQISLRASEGWIG
jgi:hypothetical protein